MILKELDKYNYTLPLELIRKQPLEPRDTAGLFVYDTQSDSITFDIFRNIAQYLPKESLIVLNNTRVLPARLFLKKETGGKVEVLVLANEIQNLKRIPVIADRKVTVGQKLFFPNRDCLEILEQDENVFWVRLVSEKNLFFLLDTYGTTPVPHYLEGEGEPDEAELRKRYQTVFASTGASVAAPTASLHFTERVFLSLAEKGIEKAEITLNVGLGTFAPLSEENFRTKKLHTEYVAVNEEVAQIINDAKRGGKPVMTVGTTVTRTLEGLAQKGELRPFSGPLNTFIYPPYDFQVSDILMTNFHLPKTSLMLLVDAFLQSKGAQKNIQELYARAIEEKFSFYSFGDSMLIL